MHSRLDYVQDWERRARVSRYSATKMARGLGVTLRFLETFFRERFGVTPHQWMVRVRMRRAEGLLAKGTAIRIVSVKAGYKQVSHFSREFKRYFGMPPRQYIREKIRKAPANRSARGSHIDN
jgi:transcriptional regulator GlxA family with amidase domain